MVSLLQKPLRLSLPHLSSYLSFLPLFQSSLFCRQFYSFELTKHSSPIAAKTKLCVIAIFNISTLSFGCGKTIDSSSGPSSFLLTQIKTPLNQIVSSKQNHKMINFLVTFSLLHFEWQQYWNLQVHVNILIHAHVSEMASTVFHAAIHASSVNDSLYASQCILIFFSESISLIPLTTNNPAIQGAKNCLTIKLTNLVVKGPLLLSVSCVTSAKSNADKAKPSTHYQSFLDCCQP